MAARSTPECDWPVTPEPPRVAAEEFQELRQRVGELEARLAAVEAGHHAWRAPEGYPHPGQEPYPPGQGVAAEPHPHAAASRVAGPEQQPGPVAPKQELSSTLLIAGAGAFIFLLGAAFFLFWSIERGYLSPTLRVALGLLVGTGLVGLAARLMGRGSPALGNTLFATGVGTQIFSLYYGAMMAQLFAPRVGLGATALLANRLQSRAEPN